MILFYKKKYEKLFKKSNQQGANAFCRHLFTRSSPRMITLSSIRGRAFLIMLFCFTMSISSLQQPSLGSLTLTCDPLSFNSAVIVWKPQFFAFTLRYAFSSSSVNDCLSSCSFFRSSSVISSSGAHGASSFAFYLSS